MAKFFTIEEVSNHNKEGDLWLIIHNKVYDVTKFSQEHPGGIEVLLDKGGHDATSAFEDVGHSSDARKLLTEFEIGIITSKDEPKVTSAPITTPIADIKSDKKPDPSPAITTTSTSQVIPKPSFFANFGLPLILLVAGAAILYRFYIKTN